MSNFPKLISPELKPYVIEEILSIVRAWNGAPLPKEEWDIYGYPAYVITDALLDYFLATEMCNYFEYEVAYPCDKEQARLFAALLVTLIEEGEL